MKDIMVPRLSRASFFFNDTATTEIYTLSLHDALPIFPGRDDPHVGRQLRERVGQERSEEHTSELQSRRDLVCRLLLEKKKKYRLGKSSSENRTTPNTTIISMNAE